MNTHNLRQMAIACFLIAVAQDVFAAVHKHLEVYAACDRGADHKGHPLPLCQKLRNPEEIWIEAGHIHELNVVSLEKQGPIDVQSTNPGVVTVEKGPDGVYLLHGRGLGSANIRIVHHAHARPDIYDLAVRGISPRVTVVGWINSSEIDVDAVAPHAKDLVKNLLSRPSMCMFTLVQWVKGGMRYPASSQQDALWAKAFLIKASGNARPPETPLTADYYVEKDFKLLTEFQTAMTKDGLFDGMPPRRQALIGRTKDPCGLLPEEIRGFDLLTMPGEEHPTHGQQFVFGDRVTYVNQTRINQKAQELERTLDERKRPRGDATPWIYALVTFWKDGHSKICNQQFPTYTIYVDGKLKEERKQSNLVDFLMLDHNSQVVPSDCR